MTEEAAPYGSAYVTAGWGIHDERWLTALRELGLMPERISLGNDVDDVDGLREQVAAVVSSGRPVLAGPMDTVTAHLAGLPGIVGLSWGHDLADLAAAGADLGWMATLSGVVVDSSANLSIAERHGVAHERITYLPWGVDLEAFTPAGRAATPDEIGLTGCSEYLLSLRAHEPLYRVADIITAFAAVRLERPTIGLVVGHAGTLTPELHTLASQLGVTDFVSFIGTVPESQLAPLLRGASCYVTASRVDGTSVTLLQAMAVGTPVVASANAGNVDWIADGRTGRLFDIGDIPALTAALVATLRPDTPISDMTEAARQLVIEQADWSANLPRLREAMLRARADLRA